MMHEWGYSYGFGIGPLGMLAVAALIVWPFWRICEKAGYPGVMALLVFIPVVNLIFLYCERLRMPATRTSPRSP